MGWESRNG